jgi:two-component system sensor histidine kinase DesK
MLGWLLLLAFPVAAAIRSNESGTAKALTVAVVAAFVAVAAVIALAESKPLRDSVAVPAVAFFLTVAIVMTVVDRENWATLFIFSAAMTAIVVREPLAHAGVALCAVLCAVTLLARGAAGGTVVGYTAPAAGIGALVLMLADLRARNKELVQTRAELARLAVAEERARFARDLHDLLGHSLSVIALKAELAGRLLPHRSDEAVPHVRDIEQVARCALTEVRDAVSGYRRPTLDVELAGARMALSAEGSAPTCSSLRSRSIRPWRRCSRGPSGRAPRT